MTDPRASVLAKNLVNFSCNVQKGENVLIEATGIPNMLVKELIKAVYERGGFPFVQLNDQQISRELLMNTSEEHCRRWADFAAYRMKDMHCYIALRGGGNMFESGDVPSEQNKHYSTIYMNKVHMEIRLSKKWVVLRYPTPSMAQSAGMSTEAFEDFYFKVCNLDYSKMDKAMDSLVAVLDKTDKVRIVSPGTDLEFSVKGIPSVKCAGTCNIPDGELYTAPVKNSVNGVIAYNTPSLYRGLKFDNVRLEFKDGKIVKESCNGLNKEITEILNSDEGARFVGEFAIGVNPYINRAVLDTLFDEKIAGSIHFTPGNAYDNADNGNRSSVHWDLILIQTKECGGGEIYFDGKLVRKDGIFVTKELLCLNPENLK